MAIKDIFKMIKADRYTQDGREELIKAQEAVTEDVTYKPGDISRKTGLQKQPDGSWAPVKNAPGNKKPDGKSGSSEKHSKAMAHAEKVGIVTEVPSGWKKAEGVTTTPNGYVAITNGASRFPKEGEAKREIKFIKQEDFDKSTSGSEKKLSYNPNGITAQLRQNMENERYEAARKDAQMRSMRSEESDRLDAEVGLHEGEGNLPDFVKGYSILSEEHDQDARAANAKIYPTLQPLVRQREPFMKKRIEAFTKLRDNPSNPKARADFVDASNAISQIDADIDREYKKVTGDSAPRTLTGDCKVRIKKSK